MPEAVTFGQNVLNDLERGNDNLRQTLKRRGFQSLTNVGKRIIKGGNIKKRKSIMKKKRMGKCYKRDIFERNPSL